MKFFKNKIVWELKYKNNKLMISANYDSISQLWNGRFKVINPKGAIVIEDDVDQLSLETEAIAIAEKKAKAWIDSELLNRA